MKSIPEQFLISSAEFTPKSFKRKKNEWIWCMP
jgi:hypothetical protein